MKDAFIKEKELFLTPNCNTNTDVSIKEMNEVVSKSKSKNVCINLIGLNIFDALKIASITSAQGLVNDLERNYTFITDNKIVEKHIKLLSLSNQKIILEKDLAIKVQVV